MIGPIQRVKGFTLIEVLVALAIVTVGMAAVLGALTSAADTTSYLRDKTIAEWIAMNRIAELRLQVKKPDEGKATGELEYAGRRWMWEQEIQDLDVPGMKRVDVSVRPVDATNSRGRAWFTTVAGIFGDAVAFPRGDLPSWAANPSGPGGRNGNNEEDNEEGGNGSQKPGGPRSGETPDEPPRNRPPPRTRLGT